MWRPVTARARASRVTGDGSGPPQLLRGDRTGRSGSGSGPARPTASGGWRVKGGAGGGHDDGGPAHRLFVSRTRRVHRSVPARTSLPPRLHFTPACSIQLLSTRMAFSKLATLKFGIQNSHNLMRHGYISLTRDEVIKHHICCIQSARQN